MTGGLIPGVVIQNNVLQEGGLGGIHIQGENPIWMITPTQLPTTDSSTAVNSANTHVGGMVDDRDQLIVDVDRTRVTFEFEDLAGGPTGGPIFGSGAVEGNGINLDSSVAYYRDDAGSPIPSNHWGRFDCYRDHRS